jgi:hypothetical protein
MLINAEVIATGFGNQFKGRDDAGLSGAPAGQ